MNKGELIFSNDKVKENTNWFFPFMLFLVNTTQWRVGSPLERFYLFKTLKHLDSINIHIHSSSFDITDNLFFFLKLVLDQVDSYFYSKKDNFHTTDDRKSCKQAHGSSNCRKLCFKISLFIFCNAVESWSGKIYPDPMKLSLQWET